MVSSVPLLVRPDSVLAVGARTDRPDYDYRDGITLRLYELAEGSRDATIWGVGRRLDCVTWYGHCDPPDEDPPPG